MMTHAAARLHRVVGNKVNNIKIPLLVAICNRHFLERDF